MIVVFARANHPHGYGYSTPETAPRFGLGAHGYVVIGIRCHARRVAERVIAHVYEHGLDLPDKSRNIYPYGAPAGHERAVASEKTARWYSGGPCDFDYLFTVGGNHVLWPHPGAAECGSRGDNRFAMVYDASKVLG